MVLNALQEMADSNHSSESASQDQGLLDRFQQVNVVLSLMLDHGTMVTRVTKHISPEKHTDSGGHAFCYLPHPR